MTRALPYTPAMLAERPHGSQAMSRKWPRQHRT